MHRRRLAVRPRDGGADRAGAPGLDGAPPAAAAATALTSLLRKAERGYAFAGIVFYQHGIIEALRNARGEDALKPGASEIGSTIAQSCILLVLLGLLWVRAGQYRRVLRHLLPYGAIMALCIASTAWSDNPLPTLRRSVSFCSCVLFGMYLQQAWGMRRTAVMAGQSAVFLGLLSIAVFVAVPAIGRETASGYENAMRGVFSQKNPMAECMLIGVVCVCFRVLDERLRWTHLAALAVLLACIVLGRSATSFGLALVILLATAVMASRGSLRLPLVAGAAWLALAAMSLMLVAPDLVWAGLSRDASFTGRAPLWQEVAGVIAQRPVFGHGYAGFWNEESGQVQYLWLRAGWRAPDSHNGYLEVLVQLGLAGLAAYLVLFGVVAARTWAALGELRESRLILLVLLANLLLNLDEGPLPFANCFTVLMAGALVSLGAWRQAQAVPQRAWEAASIAARYAP